MTIEEINIWGSCVTRDAVEFSTGISVGMYCARQSVVSSVAAPVADDTFLALQFNENTHPFHRRIVEQDFQKTSLQLLKASNRNGILILDLIEERAKLGVTHCGTYVSYSQAASNFSNARSLISRYVQAFSDEHVSLFKDAIIKFSAELHEIPIVIHRAFYAPGDWEYENANRTLSQLYDIASQHFPNALSLEMDEKIRRSELNHKWGAAPYHYIDQYYQNFVTEFSKITGVPLTIRPSFTLRKT